MKQAMLSGHRSIRAISKNSIELVPGRFIDGLQDPSGSLSEVISQTNDRTPPKDASAERLQSDYAAAEKHGKMLSGLRRSLSEQ